MSDATADFFDRLAATPGRQPLLANVVGVVRFDVGEHDARRQWCVRIDRGDVRVTTGPECPDPDSVIGADGAVFDAIARGEVNPMAAMLRGELLVDGDPQLLVAIQRLFPGPPTSRGVVAADGTRR